MQHPALQGTHRGDLTHAPLGRERLPGEVVVK